MVLLVLHGVHDPGPKKTPQKFRSSGGADRSFPECPRCRARTFALKFTKMRSAPRHGELVQPCGADGADVYSQYWHARTAAKLSAVTTAVCAKAPAYPPGAPPAAAGVGVDRGGDGGCGAAAGIGVDHGGDGGCTARALSAIGVWPTSAAAAAAMDEQIEPLHQKFVRERGACDQSEAGIRGEQWHEEAIKRAVIGEGWHVRKVDASTERKRAVAESLQSELARGRFLVFGVTNNRWARCVRGKAVFQRLKYPDYPADAPSTQGESWQHSIAVIDGELHDFPLREPISSLWLGGNHQPDRRKGYMRSISKVWRVHKCSSGDKACKGKCWRG